MAVPENQSTLAEDIRKSLECPVCLKTIRNTPIKQCKNGHIHCRECRPRIKICPICRENLTDMRNLFAEQTLMKIPIPCKFQDEGCLEKFLLSEMEEHEKICQFRLIQCVSPFCKEKISFCKYLDHVKNKKHRTKNGKQLATIMKFLKFRHRETHIQGSSLIRQSKKFKKNCPLVGLLL